MNIIICGLKGTGKTTLSKMLAEKYSLTYINDYEICKSEISVKELLNFINSNDNFVIDLCYSLSPKNCSSLKNSLAYFLGFATIDENLLLSLMNGKNEDVTINQIKDLKNQSIKFQIECKKYNLPFYDINADRKIILNNILKDIEIKMQ